MMGSAAAVSTWAAYHGRRWRAHLLTWWNQHRCFFGAHLWLADASRPPHLPMVMHACLFCGKHQLRWRKGSVDRRSRSWFAW